MIYNNGGLRKYLVRLLSKLHIIMFIASIYYISDRQWHCQWTSAARESNASHMSTFSSM